MKTFSLRRLLIASASLALAATSHGTVLLELAGGYLKDQGSTRVSAGSGLLVLVASTSDEEFTALTSASALVAGSAVASGSDDVVIYKSSIGGDGNSSGTADAGEFR